MLRNGIKTGLIVTPTLEKNFHFNSLLKYLLKMILNNFI